MVAVAGCPRAEARAGAQPRAAPVMMPPTRRRTTRATRTTRS